MARFKFGKKRKDGTIDPEISVDSENTSIEESPKTVPIPAQATQATNSNAITKESTQSPMVPSPQIVVDSPKINSPINNPHAPHAPPHASSPWTRYKLKNSPFPRYRHSASAISSDKNEVFIMGGLKEGSVFGDTWKITPIIDGNQQVQEFVAQNIVISNNNNPPARVGHSSVLIGNAYIIYGGDTVDTDFNGFPDNNFYLFNINNSKYTIPSHILNKPNGRYGHTISVISMNSQSSRLYLFGGQLENEVFNDLYYFELNTFKSPKARWNLVEPLNNFRPPPLTNHTMSVYKNRIYVFGGVYNNEKVSNDLWCFDVGSSKWTQVSTFGNIPLPVNEHAACVINDKLFVYGGNDFSGIIYNSLYVLDLHTLVWSKLTPEGEINGPGSRCGHTMTFIPTLNKILVMGGDKNDYVSDDPQDFETYESRSPGVDADTMIYQLDVSFVDEFLSSKQTVVKGKKSAVSPIKDPVSHEFRESDIGGPDFEDIGVGAGVGAAAAVGTGAAMGGNGRHIEPDVSSPIPGPGAGAVSPPVVSPRLTSNVITDHEVGSREIGSGSNTDLRSRFQRHSRSVSNGPEDFRTPEASPERKTDKFVEVPSSAVSEKGINSEFDDEYKEEIPEQVSNGHSSSSVSGVGATAGAGIVGAAAATGLGAAAGSSSREPLSQTPKGSVRSTALSGPSGAAVPAENEKVKKLINELTTELTALRQSTKNEMQNATEKIHQLEAENAELKQLDSKKLQSDVEEKDAIITQLKQQIDPSLVQINEEGEEKSPSSSITELTKYKLERLELNNKLVYLTQENQQLNRKLADFEPFMNNQIGQLSNFQKIIDKQEEKIALLSGQVKDQEVLNKEVNDWKSKHENLKLEYNNFKSIHEDIDISDDEEESNGVDTTNRSILSNSTTKRSKKDISSHLESLVNAWNSKSGSRSIDSPSSAPAVDPMVVELQTQLDHLMTISKEQEATGAREMSNLKQQLTVKSNDLKGYESNYKNALQSVNNTSKALKLTQEELRNQKVLMEKLISENNELNLYKKASKRSSTRTPVQTQEFSPNLKDVDEDDSIENAHFNMKIKDLEADLFILKQERDQLKESVTNLQKQLYLSQSN